MAKNEKKNGGSTSNTDTKPAKANPNKGKKRGPITSFKDIVMAVTLEGEQGATNLRNAGKLAKRPLQGAIKYLQERNSSHEAGILAGILEEMFPGGSTGDRGRDAPKVGESRIYKAQQTFDGREVKRVKPEGAKKSVVTVIKEGTPKGSAWLRLPLGSLGVEHGQKVKVDFNDGSIIVTPT